MPIGGWWKGLKKWQQAAIIGTAVLTLAGVAAGLVLPCLCMGGGAEAVAMRVLADPAVFGPQAATNTQLYEQMKKLHASLTAGSTNDTTVMFPVSGGPMEDAARRHGRPEEIQENVPISVGGASVRIRVYWYGPVGFGVDDGGSICAVVIRKR